MPVIEIRPRQLLIPKLSLGKIPIDLSDNDGIFIVEPGKYVYYNNYQKPNTNAKTNSEYKLLTVFENGNGIFNSWNKDAIDQGKTIWSSYPLNKFTENKKILITKDNGDESIQILMVYFWLSQELLQSYE